MEVRDAGKHKVEPRGLALRTFGQSREKRGGDRPKALPNLQRDDLILR